MHLGCVIVRLQGCAVSGIKAHAVQTEVHLIQGAKFHLVGLPDSAMKEAAVRLFSAIVHSGFRYPGKRITINMAPADIPKEGAAYDLPMALGILGASGQCPVDGTDEYLIMGELSLDGRLMPVKGALSMALFARENALKGCILPSANAQEAALVGGIPIYGMDDLQQVVAFFKGKVPLPVKREGKNSDSFHISSGLDFSEVKGQAEIKRAMEISAAGGHNLLMIGPPGSGKTMLARRLAGILPPMSFEEALETTQIHSVARRKEESSELLESRPFRAPHHSISDAALVGGGAQPQPGEISMAHNGILFLDELPEFRRSVLEVLRQPMEEGMVTIARARSVVDYPACFMLVAAMNPCPCGYQSHPGRNCSCPERAIERYMSKVSGPLMDRIDMHLEVLPVEASQLQDKAPAESSEAIRQRVVKARWRQRDRLRDSGVHSNSGMSKKQIDSFCALDSVGSTLLHKAMDRMQLSARAFDKILKISRTIADLEGVENIKDTHIAEAIQYRNLDRKAWSA